MVKSLSRNWLIGAWMVSLALVVTVCTAMAASFSTTVLLVALGVAPGIIVALLKDRNLSPSAAEVLHAIEAKDGRA